MLFHSQETLMGNNYRSINDFVVSWILAEFFFENVHKVANGGRTCTRNRFPIILNAFNVWICCFYLISCCNRSRETCLKLKKKTHSIQSINYIPTIILGWSALMWVIDQTCTTPIITAKTANIILSIFRANSHKTQSKLKILKTQTKQNSSLSSSSANWNGEIFENIRFEPEGYHTVYNLNLQTRDDH